MFALCDYSGLSATLALAHMGQAFTCFSPFLGWIGVFLTGSDTSANALFAALQATTAQHQSLMQAILDGDPQRARECIGEHLEHVRTTIQRLDEDRARRERSMRLPLDAAPALLPSSDLIRKT